jgi:hypothetical protein
MSDSGLRSKISDVDSVDDVKCTMDCGPHRAHFRMDVNTCLVHYLAYVDRAGGMPAEVDCDVTVTDKGGLTANTPLKLYVGE